MSQQDEKNFAAAMARVYNWLTEYRAREDRSWFTFYVAQSNKERARIFPGRGEDPGIESADPLGATTDYK